MSGPLRLVIFDVDGTLVDSQADILAAMAIAFDAVGLAVPDRETTLGIVGLSLDVAVPQLAPQATADIHARMVGAYKDAYIGLRAQSGVAQSSPLYPGALAALRLLSAQENLLLGVATGKSRRGLDKLIEGHGLEGMFVTQQVADFHPSKPHPSMIRQAMTETSIAAQDTVMVGDTSFDMEMAASAGVHGIGVSWGYHGRDRLEAATEVIDSFAALPYALQDLWQVPA